MTARRLPMVSAIDGLRAPMRARTDWRRIAHTAAWIAIVVIVLLLSGGPTPLPT